MGGSDSKPETLWSELERERPQTPPLAQRPWRDLKMIKWESQYSQQLLDEVKAIDTECEVVKNPGILLLGPIRAGKSTFVNSIFSIGKGRLVNKAYTGSARKSQTASFTRYRGNRGNDALKNFRLCDTMGVEDDDEEGFHVKDIINLIQGHVRDNYTFNPRKPLMKKDDAYNPDPKPEEKIHCVVFVIDVTMLFSRSVSSSMRKKIRLLQQEIKDYGIPRVLILTKVDLLCPEVEKDICNIFHSTKIQKALKIASEIFEIPETNIHPVKNYEGEIEIDPLKNIPLLLALRQILHFASDFVEGNDHDSDVLSIR